jgi:hypothetical protein
MGLYLCIFDGDDEIEGVEVGHYADFNALRDYVVLELENGNSGSKFPTFIVHSDSDGEWSFEDSQRLKNELSLIVSSMKEKPAVPFSSTWQGDIAKSIGLVPKNAFESFIDVDGEFILDRLLDLTSVAIDRQLPILFQ